jgi:hypothetical protein
MNSHTVVVHGKSMVLHSEKEIDRDNHKKFIEHINKACPDHLHGPAKITLVNEEWEKFLATLDSGI